MNKSILTIAIALITLSSCTKDSLEDGTIVSIESFDDHDHDHTSNVGDVATVLPNVADVYELASQAVIDEAIEEAEYMGLEIVMDYLADVDIYVRTLDGGAWYSAQDGTVLGTSNHFASERPFIVLDTENLQSGFTLVHEMLHHYRQVIDSSLHNQFGWLIVHGTADTGYTQEIIEGEFSNQLPSDWSVVESFEYTAQIVAYAIARGETSSDIVGQDAFNFIVNYFSL